MTTRQVTSLDRRALLRFTTLDDLPVIPGVLAVGPGIAEFETALVQDPSLPDQLVFRMDLGGSIRMLANPTSPSSWMINEPVGLAFDATIGIEPHRYATSGAIADLGLFRLHSIANQTTIGPEFEGLDLKLADQFVGLYVNNWTVDYGPNGRKAIQSFLNQGQQANLTPPI